METFEIFSAARLRDFPLLLASARQVHVVWYPSRFVVAVPSQDRGAVEAGLAGLATVVDENSLLQGFDRKAFQRRPIPHFPQSFGWYLQQFLKIEFCCQSRSPYCLVWDADTVPLKSLRFLDGQGRIHLTQAAEFHQPYFRTIEGLFGRPAPARTSFISQHMFVRTDSMGSLCALVRERHGGGHWTDALGDILESHPDRANLFSEYETYANYMLMFEPGDVAVRTLAWERSESRRTWGIPCEQIEDARRRGLDFAAYESPNALLSRIFLKSLEKAPSFLKRLAVTFVLRQSADGGRMGAV
jgi:hypothetical protein